MSDYDVAIDQIDGEDIFLLTAEEAIQEVGAEQKSTLSEDTRKFLGIDSGEELSQISFTWPRNRWKTSRCGVDIASATAIFFSNGSYKLSMLYDRNSIQTFKDRRFPTASVRLLLFGGKKNFLFEEKHRIHLHCSHASGSFEFTGNFHKKFFPLLRYASLGPDGRAWNCC